MLISHNTQAEPCRCIHTVWPGLSLKCWPLQCLGSCLFTYYIIEVWGFKCYTLRRIQGREKTISLLSVLSLAPVSRGYLSTEAEGRLCHMFSLQKCISHGASFGFIWSSFAQRVTLKKNTFPLPALPQEAARPQQFLGHFTCH